MTNYIYFSVARSQTKYALYWESEITKCFVIEIQVANEQRCQQLATEGNELSHSCKSKMYGACVAAAVTRSRYYSWVPFRVVLTRMLANAFRKHKIARWCVDCVCVNADAVIRVWCVGVQSNNHDECVKRDYYIVDFGSDFIFLASWHCVCNWICMTWKMRTTKNEKRKKNTKRTEWRRKSNSIIGNVHTTDVDSVRCMSIANNLTDRISDAKASSSACDIIRFAFVEVETTVVFSRCVCDTNFHAFRFYCLRRFCTVESRYVFASGSKDIVINCWA